MKPTRRAISLVFEDKNGRFLVTKRSPFKETYPNFWSITSTYLQNEETPEEAATRLIKHKLGLEDVELNSTPIGTSEVDRGNYILQMGDFEVTNYRGSFNLNFNQYTGMKWLTLGGQI